VPSVRIEKTDSLHNLLFRWPSREFKQAVRLDKETFLFVERMIEDDLVFQNQSFNPQKPVRLQLAVTLERLGCYGNGASVGRIARANGIGNGTVTMFTNRVVKALLKHWDTYVKWPSQAQRQQSSAYHNEHFCMPGVIGIVDGSHFILSQKPAIDGEVFFTRKKRYALNAQLICDENRRFLMAHIGFPGSCSDAVVFSQTSVFKRPSDHFSGGEYLLGLQYSYEC
jgi:hypothetical protein